MKPRIFQSLGPTIVEYSPYRRGSLAVRFLLTGSGAAGLWHLMKSVEPHIILVPLLALGALPLFFYCLSAFFRLLSPGKMVSVRERGIVLGKKAFHWKEIEKISYRLNPGASDNRQSHEFKFHLAGKNRTEYFSFEEDDLPSHVDIQEFLGHLQQGVQEVDFLDQPKVRKEQDRKRGVRRDAKLAERLRASAGDAMREASREGISPRVSNALKGGERQRKELAAGCRWSSVTAGFCSGVSTMALILIVLVGFISCLMLLFQMAFDIGIATDSVFESFGIPPGVLGYGMLGIVMAAAWWSAGNLERLANRKRKSARKQAARAKSLKKPPNAPNQSDELISAAKSKEPFGVYLRSFSGEYFQYLEKPVVGGSGYHLPIDYEVLERDFDLELTTAAESLMPIFTLANVTDPSVSRKLRILCVPDQEWFIVACELICEADVVLVHLAAVTESLLAELNVLDKLSYREKTLLIRGKQFDIRELDEEEKGLVSRFPNKVVEGAPGWREELRNFLLSRS